MSDLLTNPSTQEHKRNYPGSKSDLHSVILGHHPQWPFEIYSLTDKHWFTFRNNISKKKKKKNPKHKPLRANQ